MRSKRSSASNLGGGVVDDEREAVGLARAVVRDDQAADAMRPVECRIVAVRDDHPHVIERLAGDHPVDGVLAMVEGAVVAIAQDEVAPVLVDGARPGPRGASTPCIASAASLA